MSSDRLRSEEEVARDGLEPYEHHADSCGDRMVLKLTLEEAGQALRRSIRQDRLAVAEVVRRELLSIIDACRWTGWDDRKRLQVIEKKIQERDLPALLRRPWLSAPVPPPNDDITMTRGEAELVLNDALTIAETMRQRLGG